METNRGPVIKDNELGRDHPLEKKRTTRRERRGLHNKRAGTNPLNYHCLQGRAEKKGNARLTEITGVPFFQGGLGKRRGGQGDRARNSKFSQVWGRGQTRTGNQSAGRKGKQTSMVSVWGGGKKGKEKEKAREHAKNAPAKNWEQNSAAMLADKDNCKSNAEDKKKGGGGGGGLKSSSGGGVLLNGWGFLVCC